MQKKNRGKNITSAFISDKIVSRITKYFFATQYVVKIPSSKGR